MPSTNSTLPWSQYRARARELKTAQPKLTPTGIRLVLGEPHIDGRRIEITSDGQGGIKQRNRGLHRFLEVQRQIRLRLQTPQQTAGEKREIKALKEELRGLGLEVDHINEVAILGPQLERVMELGGQDSLAKALNILWGAGYKTGNDIGNLQGLTPEQNKQKRDEWARLQRYLGLKEKELPSPSAARTDLIVTADPELEETLKGTPQETPDLPTQTPPLTTPFGAKQPLGGFATDTKLPEVQPEPKVNLSPQVMETNGNGNGAYVNGNGNGNGNGDENRVLHPLDPLTTTAKAAYTAYRLVPRLVQTGASIGLTLMGVGDGL